MNLSNPGGESFPNNNLVEENINYILSLTMSKLPLFPIKVMTYSMGQIEVKDSKEILQLFGKSGFLDCRINAYPVYSGYNGLNTTKKVMIFIDIDLNDFKKSKDASNQLEKYPHKIVLKIKQETNGNPLVLWTGGGYHLYQPVSFDKMLTSIHFNKYAEELNQNLTNLFMRFSAWYFSDGKSDSNHNPSFKSCLLRVPGTINSKYKNIVTIVEKGQQKAVQLDNIQEIKEQKHEQILFKFEDWLIQQEIDIKLRLLKISKRKKERYFSTESGIPWINNLLDIPLDDFRHYCLWRILIPYLVNVKGVHDFKEITDILSPWLNKCNSLRRLSFNPSTTIRSMLKSVGNYRPLSLNKLKDENETLYQLIYTRKH
jgi:hypothetical protein